MDQRPLGSNPFPTCIRDLQTTSLWMITDRVDTTQISKQTIGTDCIHRKFLPELDSKIIAREIESNGPELSSQIRFGFELKQLDNFRIPMARLYGFGISPFMNLGGKQRLLIMFTKPGN